MSNLSSPPSLINNRYRLAEWLGQGNMGVVYRAIDEMLNRPVVIKFLLSGPGRAMATAGTGSPESRFLREARSVARLSHPNIMSIYDMGRQEKTDKNPADPNPWEYLVLEYIPGKDLHAILRQRGGRMPIPEALEILRAVLTALAYAHEHGIIHRDIKPDNIRITPEGQVKVADFGLALVEGEARMTQEGAVVGTALYLAPECLLGQTGDVRSDLYAVGAVMYEMVSGRPPFMGDSIAALIGAILYGSIEPLRKLVPEASPALEEWAARALARDPSQRFASAQEALEALSPKETTWNSHSAPESASPEDQAGLSSSLEEERRRMASLLNNRVVEPLNLLLAQAGTFEQTLGGHAPARMALSVVSTLARQVLQQARDLEDHLHPGVLEALGLEPALEAFKDQIARATGLSLTLELDHLPTRLPASLEIQIYRLAQEALEAAAALPTNRAALRLLHEQDSLRLEVEWQSASSLPERTLASLRRKLAAINASLDPAPTAGRSCLSIRIPLRAPVEFTARELDVLQGLVDGLTNKEIASRLSVSPRTINFHLDNIYAKLGVSTRTEAAVIAQRYGWARRHSNIAPAK